MQYQGYCLEIEKHFSKSEYITISQLSVKMLTRPHSCPMQNTELYCFVINDTEPSAELCEKLAKYALSVNFYDDPHCRKKTVIVPVFVSNALSEGCRSFIKQKAQKKDGVIIVPAAFDVSEQNLICCENYPLALGAFCKITEFINTNLKPQNKI